MVNSFGGWFILICSLSDLVGILYFFKYLLMVPLSTFSSLDKLIKFTRQHKNDLFNDYYSYLDLILNLKDIEIEHNLMEKDWKKCKELLEETREQMTMWKSRAIQLGYNENPSKILN